MSRRRDNHRRRVSGHTKSPPRCDPPKGKARSTKYPIVPGGDRPDPGGGFPHKTLRKRITISEKPRYRPYFRLVYQLL